MDGMILEAEPPEPEKHAIITSGIFRRELVHAPEPTTSCVLWVAGVSGDGERYDEIVEVLNRAGFDVLRFGGWTSEKDLSPLSIHDVLIAIEDTERILRERGYAFIGYLGKSFGGLLGLLSRSGYDRMVLWAPAVSLGSASDTRTRISDLRRIFDFSVSEESLAQKTWPILLISGANDEVLPLQAARALVEALANGEGLEVETGHSVERAVETLEATIDYLTRTER